MSNQTEQFTHQCKICGKVITTMSNKNKLSDAAPPSASRSESRGLRFADAVRIARGCMDYSGGHRHDGQLEVYHHGIQTVINALEAADKNQDDTQVRALWMMGGVAGISENHGK